MINVSFTSAQQLLNNSTKRVQPQITTASFKGNIAEDCFVKTSQVSFKGEEETVQSVIAKLIDGAKSGEAKEWSWMANTNGGSLLSCVMNGKQYKFEAEKTNETYEKEDGNKYYVFKYSLKVGNPENPEKVYTLTQEEANKYIYKDLADDIVLPKIEKQYGLDSGFDTSPITLELARQTLFNEITWEWFQGNVRFGEGLTIKADGAARTKMKDGTDVYVIQKSTGSLFGFDVKTYLGIQKDNLPPQLILISGDKEEKAGELLGMAFKILEKENEFKEGLKQVQEARNQLNEEIGLFKTANSQNNPKLTEPVD